MPSLRVMLLVAALFTVVVLLRLPAAWVTPLLPDRVQCESPSGTAWNGRCATLIVDARPLANASWELLPDELLHGKIGLRLKIDDASLQASAKVLLALKGRVQCYDLLLRLPLPSPLAPGTPPGWSATLELDLPRLEARGEQLQSISGTVRVRQLQQAQPRIDFGGFEWLLAEGALANGRVSGAVRDLGGPLRLQGTLTAGLKGDYDLDARAAAGPGADDTLQRALQQMGPADPQGFHSLLVAGTL